MSFFIFFFFKRKPNLSLNVHLNFNISVKYLVKLSAGVSLVLQVLLLQSDTFQAMTPPE